MRTLCAISDLSDEEILWILDRARALAEGARPDSSIARAVVGLVFLEPSLRTRVGFAIAAARLGWSAVEVTESRGTGGGYAESIHDTVRTVSGQCDLVVVRPGCPLSELEVVCPVINGGDAGPSAEHPTQALIDLFAIESLRGPIEGLSVAIVGDLTMRTVRSLLALFRRRPPAEVVLVGDVGELTDHDLVGLSVRAESLDISSATDSDVLYVAGIPHGSISREDRRRLVVTERLVNRLSPASVVLSPMPVMDEVEQSVRSDPRMKGMEQADLGSYVRLACLELVGGVL